MKDKIEMSQNDDRKKVKTSQELLSVRKQNRGKKIVKSLLKSEIEPERKRKVFETYKDEESPLLNRLQDFFPKFKKSTIDIASKPDNEKEKLDIENVGDSNRVIEMDLIFGRMNDGDSSSSEEDSSDSENETETIKEFHPQSLQIVKNEQNCCEKKLISEVTADSASKSSKGNR
ncbi:UNVERIFIED_CONTAM: hypothetical protein RMT77_014186 [Armadillidium vulgare]